MTTPILTTTDKFIVGIDPGVTTGVAWMHFGEFQSAEFDEHEFYGWVGDNAEFIEHMQIEFFTINAATVKKQVVYDSVYLIGYLRYMAWKTPFEVGFTKPADVMATFTDAALKRVGMFNKGKGHANDAARHLSWYLVKQRLISGSLYLP